HPGQPGQGHGLRAGPLLEGARVLVLRRERAADPAQHLVQRGEARRDLRQLLVAGLDLLDDHLLELLADDDREALALLARDAPQARAPRLLRLLVEDRVRRPPRAS